MLSTLRTSEPAIASLCGRRYGNARGTYRHSSQPERFSGAGIVSATALTELLRASSTCTCEPFHPFDRRMRHAQIVHQFG